MERLTKVDGCGENDLIRCFDCNLEKAGENLENCGYCEEGWRKALDRLAAYEDTGLEPEEVKDMAENVETRLLVWFEAKYGAPVGRLMELMEANNDGRLVVLPFRASENVGSAIREARENAGLTQKELGERLGLPYQSIAQWECGLRKPKLTTMCKIADALKAETIGNIQDNPELLGGAEDGK